MAKHDNLSVLRAPVFEIKLGAIVGGDVLACGHHFSVRSCWGCGSDGMKHQAAGCGDRCDKKASDAVHGELVELIGVSRKQDFHRCPCKRATGESVDFRALNGPSSNPAFDGGKFPLGR